MRLHELIVRTRSCRRFKQDPVDRDTLRALVDLARLSASGANLQPLKYLLSCEPERNASLFPHTVWAGYLADWPGPAEGERPTAYIVILLDREIGASPGCDHGIAAQSIVLGAAEKGLGACIIGSLKREAMRRALDLAARYEILLVVALGVPAEQVVLEDLPADGSIRYYRDAADVHHVPKRGLDEVIVG
jgi:nitroreductase